MTKVGTTVASVPGSLGISKTLGQHGARTAMAPDPGVRGNGAIEPPRPPLSGFGTERRAFQHFSGHSFMEN